MQNRLLPFFHILTAETNADMILVGRVDADRKVVETVAWFGMEEEVARQFRVPLGKCLIGLTAQSGQAHQSEDMKTDSRVTFSKLMNALGMKSVVCQPIQAEAEVIGVLTLVWRSYQSIRREEHKLITMVADALGMFFVDPLALTAFTAAQVLLNQAKVPPASGRRLDSPSARWPGNGRPVVPQGWSRAAQTPRYLEQLLAIGREKIRRIATYDQMQGMELLRTLTVALTSCSVQEACARLFIHKNTYRYRLHRIEEITGVNLDKPTHRFLLMLGLIESNGIPESMLLDDLDGLSLLEGLSLLPGRDADSG